MRTHLMVKVIDPVYGMVIIKVEELTDEELEYVAVLANNILEEIRQESNKRYERR